MANGGSLILTLDRSRDRKVSVRYSLAAALLTSQLYMLRPV